MSKGNTVAHAVRCALSERATRPGAVKLSGLLYLLATSSVGIQTVLADPSPAEESSSTARRSDVVQEVVVVGSRIRRDNFNAPAPVQVIDRNETTLAGFSTTAEVLQGTAVTAGAAQINNSFGGFVTNGGPGANTLSLRGLGAERTLILINGRRVSPSGTRGAVGAADLNVLPSAIVDRTEILKDGASSVYGSDAIAGVVTINTRKDVQGLNFEASYKNPEIDAGQETQLSLVGGLSGERWRVSGSLEFTERQKVTLGDRAFTSCSPDGTRDPVTGASRDFIDPTTGQPKCFTIGQNGSQGVTINTIGVSALTDDGTALVPVAGVAAAGTMARVFNRFRPNSAVTTGLFGFEGVGGPGSNNNVRDTFEPRVLNASLNSPAKTYTAFLEGSYDLQALGNAEVFFEFLGNQRRSNQVGYRQLLLDYRLDSALIPAELAFSFLQGPSATTGDDPVGVRAFIGFGNDVNKQEVDFYKPTLGIRGDLTFLEGWRYDGYVSYAKSDGDFAQQSFFTDKLTLAGDVVAAPMGTDPSLVRGGLTCRINLTNPGERCIPYPALNSATVGGNLPQDFRNYIFRDVNGNTEFEERTASATIDGGLFKLPYGEVKAVFGVEYRRQEITDLPDANSVAGNLFNLTSSAVTSGSDTVREAYTEVEVPILEGLPGANALTATGSYRYTDYNSFGSDTTYRYGVVFSPIREIALRYNRGTSFRAPALFEQFQGATSGFLAGTVDPCNDFGNSDDPTLQANCAMELKDPAFQQRNGVRVVSQGGAANGLDAETSDNQTYGIVVQPDLGRFGRLSVAVDYFDIEINNGVSQVGGDNILPLCYTDPQFRAGGGFCNLVTRNPVDNSLAVSNQFTNIATQGVRGLDYNLRYEIPIGPGSLLVNTLVTQFKGQPFRLFPTDPDTEVNDTVTAPKLTGSLDLTYSLNKWTFRYGVDYVEGSQSYDLLELDPVTSLADLQTGDYFEHNTSVRYASDKWQATLGVRNLYDETPPFVSSRLQRTGRGALYSGFDQVGREVFLRAALQFGQIK